VHGINLCESARKVCVVVSTTDLVAAAEAVCQPLHDKHNVQIVVSVACAANKQKQIVRDLKSVSTEIVVFADDHVFWPACFLETALAPFEEIRVATVKRVRRQPQDTFLPDILNMLGCLYLERHNFEILSTNNLDGGIFVVS
jgi:Glycosyltransferase like family 2